MSRDVQQRPLDANEFAVTNLGPPGAKRDATFTDNETLPAPNERVGKAGTSLLAAPSDHVHPNPAPLRIAASGRATIAAGTRVTLATIRRAENELFPPGGFVFVRDNVAGVTWENEVTGADHVATYHERTAQPDQLVFRATNGSDKARTLDWATAALAVFPAA